MPLKEIWKRIPGYPGYVASNMGRVKRLAYTTVRGYNRAEKILKMSGRSAAITLNLKEGKTSQHAGRLVLLAFKGKPRGRENLALHEDDNTRNNIPSNLRWGSRKDNALDAVRNGIMGKNSPHAEKHKARWKNMSSEQYQKEILRRRTAMFGNTHFLGKKHSETTKQKMRDSWAIKREAHG